MLFKNGNTTLNILKHIDMNYDIKKNVVFRGLLGHPLCTISFDELAHIYVSFMIYFRSINNYNRRVRTCKHFSSVIPTVIANCQLQHIY